MKNGRAGEPTKLTLYSIRGIEIGRAGEPTKLTQYRIRGMGNGRAGEWSGWGAH